jgi:hypothetical protein
LSDTERSAGCSLARELQPLAGHVRELLAEDEHPTRPEHPPEDEDERHDGVEDGDDGDGGLARRASHRATAIMPSACARVRGRKIGAGGGLPRQSEAGPATAPTPIACLRLVDMLRLGRHRGTRPRFVTSLTSPASSARLARCRPSSWSSSLRSLPTRWALPRWIRSGARPRNRALPRLPVPPRRPTPWRNPDRPEQRARLQGRVSPIPRRWKRFARSAPLNPHHRRRTPLRRLPTSSKWESGS